MQRVQFAELMRRPVAERGGVESGQMLFLRKLLEERRGGTANMGVMGERLAALADVDGSQLSGPFVQVAEQGPVNGLPVGEVKSALKRRLRKFIGSCRNKGRLGSFERGGVRDAEAIL